MKGQKKVRHLYESGRDELTHLYDEGRDKIYDTYQDAKDKAGHIGHQIKSKASDLYEEGKETIVEYSDEFVHAIKERPFTSVFIAGAIGFILAKLFRRRH